MSQRAYASFFLVDDISSFFLAGNAGVQAVFSVSGKNLFIDGYSAKHVPAMLEAVFSINDSGDSTLRYIEVPPTLNA
ncbi:hypothetical protein QNZ44_004659 [Enterobacter kobei]